MKITISKDFERNKYAVIALYLNITLITRLMSSLYSIITRRAFSQYASTFQWIILVIPLGYFFLHIIVRGIKKSQWAIVIMWSILMIITRYITRPQAFLIRQAIVEGLSHVVIPAVMIQEVSDIRRMLTQLEKYVGICTFTCLLQYITPGLARNAYYSFSYITFIPAVICLGNMLNEKKAKQWGSFLIISVTNFIYGGRGFFLCIAVFLVFYSSMYFRSYKVQVLVAFFLILAAIYALFGDAILSNLSGRGFNSRTLAFLTGEKTDNSRFLIWRSLMNEFAKSPFKIRGLLADREYLAVVFNRHSERAIAGWYSHNFVVEIIFEFGICGIILLLYVFRNVYNINRRLKLENDTKITLLFIVISSLFFGKLSISSSYLIDLSSGIFLGFILVYRRNNYSPARK